MRRRAEYDNIRALISAGVNDCAIARTTGVPRGTVKEWRNRTTAPGDGPWGSRGDHGCPRCGSAPLERTAYSYLLGLYLGDGCISRSRRGIYFLRITLDAKYPEIISECAATVAAVSSRHVQLVRRRGCFDVQAYWNHWPCVFPQHGPGPKHLRSIPLAEWQIEIVRHEYRAFLRGLLHSDGSRTANRVNGAIYPRYEFTNFSKEILNMFCWACDLAGVHWTRPKAVSVSVARRLDVQWMDTFVGPKR